MGEKKLLENVVLLEISPIIGLWSLQEKKLLSLNKYLTFAYFCNNYLYSKEKKNERRIIDCRVTYCTKKKFMNIIGTIFHEN